MGYRKIDDASLIAVADAIREKGGTSEPLTFPGDFVTAVQGISSGSGVNFVVTAYPTETDLLSATPPDNTIGVVTTTEITSWSLAPQEPSASPGKVWIKTGMESDASFNVLEENEITVCLILAKQYVDGEWVDKPAKSRQNSKWVDWWNGELYIDGNQYESITGGWWSNPELKYKTYSYTEPTDGYEATDNTTNIKYISMECPANKSVNLTTRNKIDLTNFSELRYDVLSGTSSNADTVVFIHSLESGSYDSGCVASSGNEIIPITDAIKNANDGKYYITVGTVNGRTININSIRLE